MGFDFAPSDALGECRFPSPLPLAEHSGQGRATFVADPCWIRSRIEVTNAEEGPSGVLFERAGPRAKLFFDPRETRAAVVTCGGLCPGLNNVLRSLFLELHHRYGVRHVLGIRDGYQGLTPRLGRAPLPLTCELVEDIHHEGGTLLGSSRGPQEPAKMADFLAGQGIDLLFCVGGDGTHRGAMAIAEETRRRGMSVAVVGIPKTIDADIAFCDRTFGFSTAVEQARAAIHSAHTEARCTRRGVGLVKLMGREAGFIACRATLVSQDVNFCLIPEAPFQLAGPKGLLEALGQRVSQRDHAVVVVAEGAGQYLFDSDGQARDASGNPKLHDIGPFLKQKITEHFAARGEPVDVKYIDPSYLIRSVPANCDDSLLCDQLARSAVHAAMAGRTGLMIGYLNSHFVHVPIGRAVAEKKRVDVESPTWAAVLSATGQPASFG